MTCYACGEPMTGPQCSCGWKPQHADAPPSLQPYVGTSRSAGHITKEQFGLSLFECIKLFAGRDQVRRNWHQFNTSDKLDVTEKNKRLRELEKRDKDLTQQILAVIPTLQPDDQRRLLEQYEPAADHGSETTEDQPTP